MKEVKDRVTCPYCGVEFATVKVKIDGSRSLVVHMPVALNVAPGKEQASIVCPKCGKESPTDLSFWRRF